MKRFGVVTRVMTANYEQAFSFLSDLRTLPSWTVLFSDADEKTVNLEFPDGSTHRIEVSIFAERNSGVIDWKMSMPDGQVQTAYSRLVKLDEKQFIYHFMFLVPPVPSHEAQLFYDNQRQLIETEFTKLQAAFDARPELQA